jgi:hypothetical protein
VKAPRIASALIVELLALLFVASPLHAESTERRWGLSAGIFRSGGEASVIWRKSQRTAVVLDLLGSHSETTRITDNPPPTPPQRNVESITRVELGPRLRKFVGSSETWRPYLDAFLHGSYSRGEFTFANSLSERGVGGRSGLAFGVERELP